MNTTEMNITPHPKLLDMLFAHKSNVCAVFNDVLGLHDVNHIAISWINNNHELLSFSSTPALEFNLFNTNLWRFDKTFQPDWYQLCTQSSWEALYTQDHYDELYYIKQAKHQYPLGISLAANVADNAIIYSIASHKKCQAAREFFAHHYDDFYKMGEYCTRELMPLFLHCDQD